MLLKSKTYTNTETSQNSVISKINITVTLYTFLLNVWLKLAKIPESGDQIVLKFRAALVQDLLGPLEIPALSNIARIRPQHGNYQSWSKM